MNSVINGKELIFKVTIKAAISGNYRVGAFLLEDNIYVKQVGVSEESYLNTHNGVIRYIDSETMIGGRRSYCGYSLGKINPCDTKDYVFVWNLDEIWEEGSRRSEMHANSSWHTLEEAMENLHLAVFTCTTKTDDNGEEFYYVNNVVDCPLDSQVPFEYN